MLPQLHTLQGYAEGPIPALVHTPQSLETLDDLLRPASSAPSRFPLLRPRLIDWTAVATAVYVYLLAFLVWLYLAK